MRIRSSDILILALLLSACLADNAATIAAFKARTSVKGWLIEWVVTQADHDACIAVKGQCCLKPAKLTPTSDSTSKFTITGDADGTCSGTKSFAVYGWAEDSDLLSGKEAEAFVGFQDNISSKVLVDNTIGVGSDLIVFDNSKDATVSFGILLPSTHDAYSSTKSFNKLWISLPTETKTPISDPTPSTPSTSNNGFNVSSTSSFCLFAASAVTMIALLF